MFGLFGMKMEKVRLSWDRGVETVEHRDLVSFFESEEAAEAYAKSWALKGGGFAVRSVLGGYTEIDIEDFSEVPHSPASK